MNDKQPKLIKVRQERFTVYDTLDGFTNWLNSYGDANQPQSFRSKLKGFLNPAEGYAFDHHVYVKHGQAGFLAMQIRVKEPERLDVNMDVMTQINVIGRLTPGVENPFTSEVHAYVDKLLEDIYLKYGAEKDGRTLDLRRLLAEVFVLEGDLTQGTCFNLAGVGLVTCQHVLAPSLMIFHPLNLTKRFSVGEHVANEVIDLARISAPGLQLGEGLPVGSPDHLEMMDEIYLVGFPNYRVGDSGSVAPGRVTGFRNVSGIRRILINAPIIAGNSGGPVLNHKGEVIGVAVTGTDRMEDAGATENHGIVPIDALALL